jgi:oxaloacetate decarboxylase alpha subunit
MAELGLLDVSIRDGNQSLWGATGLTTPQILEIAPAMDRVGFRALDFTSSTHMGVAVRTHRENPWERIRLTREAMPNTPLQFIGTGMRFISWERAHPDLMQLVYDRLVVRGISRFIVLDPTHDADAMLQSARMLRRAGAELTVAALTYTVSAVHDDAFYAALAARLAGSPDLDRFYLKDPAGLLTPDRARTLIPAVRARLRGKPLELHSHCTIGLSQLTYLEAAGSASRCCTWPAGRCPTARRCPTRSAPWPTCASWGTRWRSTTACSGWSRTTSGAWPGPSPGPWAACATTTRPSCATRWPEGS